MNTIQESIAKHLLEIQAVTLRPNKPFIWSSGIEAPIYCDNRLTLSYPEVRKAIAHGLAELIKQHFPYVQIVAGIATGGIPHAAWVSDLLDLPMVYVRSSAKGHGKGNQVEGRIQEGDKAVVIEDLISTGKSTLEAVDVLRQAGVDVIGALAIFTYGFKQADDNFKKAKVPYYTLSNYQTLIDEAEQNKQFSTEDIEKLRAWNPFN